MCNVSLDLLIFIESSLKKYSQVGVPYTQFTCKNKLKEECEAKKVFQNVKFVFTIALILIHLDLLKPFYIETNASSPTCHH